MKANELTSKDLMVGDWCYIKDYPMSAQPMQVKEEHFVRSLVEFEPIPLTPEILEKNGWIKSELNLDFYCGNLEYKNYNIQIHNNQDSLNTNNKWLIHIETIYYEGISQSEITYIHQLQHVLKLCKIDKEIVV